MLAMVPPSTSNTVTCTAPVNIAVIKYWGKRDTALLLPTNSSLSVTLSQTDLETRTTARASPDFKRHRLWLNGTEETVDGNKRLTSCLTELLRVRKKLEEASKGSLPPLSTYGIHICSENNFPTAAGLASSAAGYACLVYTVANLLELPLSKTELSRIARQGSGSACRSLFGGFVAWEMGVREDGLDSQAVQVAEETHWPELEMLIVVASAEKKATSSTLGMQSTVPTSELLQHRIRDVAPKRMKEMEKAIRDKDFQTFAKLTMMDSNQFHAVCLDTFPPIFYLNEVSRGVISLVTAFNEQPPEQNFRAAYTFDAGPNAVIFTEKQNVRELLSLIIKHFPKSKTQSSADFFADPYSVCSDAEEYQPAITLDLGLPVYPAGAVKQILHTRVGDGPRIVGTGDDESLLNSEGFPKRLAE